METSVITLLVLAFIAANLPFATQRLAGIKKLANKHFGWHLLELVALYLLLGLLARVLEGRISPVHVQNWQFYVTTFSLFVVFAFPGFVARYFWSTRSH
ncbi:DUF2818 family protein [Vogesella mureinivorans]|uniref:DUF2818 family protein n=1 Tax=Vogesella mureinivorans TaxID=657276 RepID=UPI0011CC631F|nr:DUF2818 family protein [Vogesella mureinivorans]